MRLLVAIVAGVTLIGVCRASPEAVMAVLCCLVLRAILIREQQNWVHSRRRVLEAVRDRLDNEPNTGRARLIVSEMIGD